MPIELKIPEVGESITEVLIAEWLKAEGDSVNKAEPVAVIDSEKTTFELPAPESGKLGKILHQAGETVAVGEVIGHLEPGAGNDAQSKSADKTVPSVAKEATEKPKAPSASLRGNASAPAKTAKPPKAERENGDPAEAKEATTVKVKAPATPSAKSKGKESTPAESKPVPAAEDSVAETDSAETSASAPEEQKVELAPASEGSSITKAADGEEEIVPMSMLRRTVARRLVEAKQQMAMLTTFNEVDLSAVQALRHEHREAFEKRYQVRLGLMSFFVKAAVDALKQFPQLNAEVRDKDIVYRNYFNIGVALASGRGLVVPVLRRADRMSFADVEKALGDFSQRAKAAKLKPDDLEGATFTITNGGVFGSLLSTPIINPPQAGILGMHAIQERPVALQGQVVIRPMMYLALTYDHRLVDGREAVLFTRRIKEAIEAPARMLLEI